MRKLLRRFELRVAVLAALALLVAQLGAMAHAYSHDVAAASAATHQSAASGHEPCNDCLSYSPLLSTAGSAAPLPTIEPQGRGLSTRATAGSLIARRATLAFRSRAPPVIR